MDKAHVWTDAELKRLEKQIKTEYTKAYQECKKEMVNIMQKISTDPDMPLSKKLAEMNKYDRLDKMCEQMASVLKDTNSTTAQFIKQSSLSVFKTNYNFNAKDLGFSLIDNTAVKNILTGQVNPFTQLSIAAGADKGAITRKLKSEMMTAILKGESIPNISKRIKSVAESQLQNTIRIARTETTRIENSARQSVGDEGAKLGFNMWKRWIATDDHKTRDAHREADRQEVPYDEPFIVDKEELMYPGDISMGASGENVINCRCTMITFIKK